ncbi:unnamed protein product [Lupinus luteus]|uniref:Uncharacterized protein n=1 Tax=Lupinus luteus TaxID=3873 RepID=A0AAV1W9C9_LUPLU
MNERMNMLSLRLNPTQLLILILLLRRTVDMIQQGLDCNKVADANSIPLKKKTTPLRDLHNHNNQRITTHPPATAIHSNTIPALAPATATHSNTISGTKRPSPHCLQHSPPTTNGHLVYVRRKSESELPKITPSANPIIINNSFSPNSTHLSGNPSLPISLHNSTITLPPLDSTRNPKGFQNLHWEDRYQQLHMFLTNLDISHQQEYIKMLRSLSSVELSRHAVELEKRSIQLSLEEARELQRVRVLNVLEKPVKNNFKAPADHEECSDKLKTPS